MPRGMTAPAIALLLVFFTAPGGAAPAAAALPRCTPAGTGEDSFCTIKGLRLHYVDWGGSGPVVILLTGLGDSARIYDDFAPRLRSRGAATAPPPRRRTATTPTAHSWATFWG